MYKRQVTNFRLVLAGTALGALISSEAECVGDPRKNGAVIVASNSFKIATAHALLTGYFTGSHAGPAAVAVGSPAEHCFNALRCCLEGQDAQGGGAPKPKQEPEQAVAGAASKNGKPLPSPWHLQYTVERLPPCPC